MVYAQSLLVGFLALAMISIMLSLLVWILYHVYKEVLSRPVDADLGTASLTHDVRRHAVAMIYVKRLVALTAVFVILSLGGIISYSLISGGGGSIIHSVTNFR